MDLKNPTECSHALNVKGVCMEPHVIEKLGSAYEKEIKQKNKDNSNPNDVVSVVKDVVQCKEESCLLESPEIKNIIGHEEARKQLEERFKPQGPHDSNNWFSNVNIDAVLDQVANNNKNKRFLHITFQMRDFQETRDKLATIDLAQKYREGIRYFGVVFNTDTSKGRGQHWFSLFGDFSVEPFTIEYFNSSGEDPLDEISRWMKYAARYLSKKLNKKVIAVCVTKIVNQNDNHSCGSYSLYYIMSRLTGIGYKFFTTNKIGDAKMHEFRRDYLFRKT